jgi:hypothetical protein
MRSAWVKLSLAIAVAVLASGAPAAAPAAEATVAAPTFTSIGPLTFGADDVLFAADVQAAAIYAVDLGGAATGGAPGTKAIPAVDQQIAALLGTDVREIAVTDLAVHPKSRNAFISVMRGQGTNARPVLLRADGAGKLTIVDLSALKASKVALPNAPSASAEGRAATRVQSITDMAYMDGRLYVAGLSNEEFSSKLRSLSYPFTTADGGTSVEIFHGNHGQFETRSPVYTFVPYKVDNQPYLIAGYLCTPLVKFPVTSLKPGSKILGTTIAELGNRNRPLDMILYKKDGKEFLLMSNNSRGVMKIPTERFGNAEGITKPVTTEKGGIGYETITSMKGIEQLDLLDETHSLVLARSDAGTLNLEAPVLP